MLSILVEQVLRAYSRVAFDGQGAYRFVRLARRFIGARRWQSTFTTPDGFSLHLDLSTYPDCCMAFGLYELDTARWLKRWLRPGDHFVDGGANVGYFTMLAARCVGPSGRVDAFEPQPQNRDRLQANLARNGLDGQVHVHPEALSDRSGPCQIHMFYDQRSNHGCASMFAAPSRAAEAGPGRTARLDEVLDGLKPHLVKLDIEGAEPLAIDGSAGLLAAEAGPRFIVEFNPESAREAGFQPDTWIQRLRTLDPRYRFSRIGRRLKPLEPDAGQLHSIGQANLLASYGPGPWHDRPGRYSSGRHDAGQRGLADPTHRRKQDR